ncbi:MAG: serine/threonine protein kinase [Firmicutes bacterium]|nr:serine/threonine protein kinase [Bacillota bacterium]MBR6970453.1 serine/threonine protein kinase [Bacillota bacterium]
MYDFFLSIEDSPFDVLRTLRDNERGKVLMLRHKGSGTRYVFRQFAGNGDVYHKLLAVRSPYLPCIWDVFTEGEQTVVLEEFIEGDTLHEVLKGGLLTSEETRRTATDLCKALYVLHGLGAVHRDVKPENVILRGENAVLVDFDASRVIKPEHSQDTVVLGTMGFAAPEQYGLSQTDGRSDIYSLGVLINVMLTGKHPSRQLAEGRWGNIVAKCTAAAPQKRYQSVTELMEDL